MIALLGLAVGGLVAGLIVAILLGWLVALLWNGFPFLEAVQHLSWLDGTLLLFLTNILFKSSSSNS